MFKKIGLFLFFLKKAALRSLAAPDSVIVLRGCGLFQHHIFLLHNTGPLLTHGHQALLCSSESFLFLTALCFLHQPCCFFKGAKEVEHLMGCPLNEMDTKLES